MSLPDAMDQALILQHFDELLRIANGRQHDRDDIAQALFELADRYWHTYTMVPPDYKNRIEQWVADTWHDEALTREYVETIAGIAGRLGLNHVLKLFGLSLGEKISLPMCGRS